MDPLQKTKQWVRVEGSTYVVWRLAPCRQLRRTIHAAKAKTGFRNACAELRMQSGDASEVVRGL